MNRILLKSQLVELFKDDSILQYELNVTHLDSQGRPEKGTGAVVTKKIFSVFFTEFLSSCTVGRSDKVPYVRHYMSRNEWCSVARILTAGLKVEYYPLALSRAFMVYQHYSGRTNYRILCDCNGNRTHNHLAPKQTLNHLTKLAK